jgi:hypothetical protein
MPSKQGVFLRYKPTRFTFIMKVKGWATASRESISTCKCQKVVVVINKASCFILTSGCRPPVGTLSENSRSSISSLPTCRMFVWCIKCPSASDYTTVPHNLTLSRGGHRRMIFFCLLSACLKWNFSTGFEICYWGSHKELCRNYFMFRPVILKP